jgi:hypothetical protein
VITRSEMLAHEVTLRLDVDRALPRVCGDRVQLQQVLVNLIVNACDAMTSVPPAERRLTIRGASDPGGEARLSITDTGPGIAAAPADRIFEPFFSSKAEGLGLGLSICRKIIIAHGGQLWGENNADGGATFHITLPIALERDLDGDETPPIVRAGHGDPLPEPEVASRSEVARHARRLREATRRLRDERQIILEQLRALRRQREARRQRIQDDGSDRGASSPSLPPLDRRSTSETVQSSDG